MEVFNQKFRELQRKHDELRLALTKLQSDVELIKRISSDANKQIIWQFIILTATMIVASYFAQF